MNSFIVSGHGQAALNISVSLKFSPSIAHLTLARVAFGLHLNCRVGETAKREDRKEQEEEAVFTMNSCAVWGKRQWPQVKKDMTEKRLIRNKQQARELFVSAFFLDAGQSRGGEGQSRRDFRLVIESKFKFA